VAALAQDTRDLLQPLARQHSDALRAAFASEHASAAEAAAVVHLVDLDGAVGIADLGVDTGIEPRLLTGAFTGLGASLGLDWAQGIAADLNPSDPWERLLVAGLARDFQQMRLDFLRRLLGRRQAKLEPSAAVAEWAEEHAAAVRQFRAIVARAQATVPIAPATLAQIASQARNLLSR
jgi:glutamate dehydrogenase